MLLELPISSHYRCVPEISQHVDNGERERELQNISDITTAQSEGKKKELEDCEPGGRRGGGCAASLTLHLKHHSTFSFFFFFLNRGRQKG